MAHLRPGLRSPRPENPMDLPKSGKGEARLSRPSPALDPTEPTDPHSLESQPPPPSWSPGPATSSGSPGYVLDESRTGPSMQLDPSSPAPPPVSPAWCQLDKSSLEA